MKIILVHPGTKIFDLIQKKGKIKIKNWDQYSQFDQRGYFSYPGLTAQEAASYAVKAYKAFYLNPKVILRLLKRKETWLNLPNVIAGGAHYLLQRDI